MQLCLHAWLPQVGRALRRDMERAGIHLAGAARARLDGLTARTHELGLIFGTACSLVHDQVVACLMSYLPIAPAVCPYEYLRSISPAVL
jgi:hypothetical protein